MGRERWRAFTGSEVQIVIEAEFVRGVIGRSLGSRVVPGSRRRWPRYIRRYQRGRP